MQRHETDNLLTYAGVYLNLARSVERRDAMEAQLERLRLSRRYTRFEAIDGNPHSIRTSRSDGEVGCFLSHYAALKAHGYGNEPLHIIEDDVVLSSKIETFLAQGIKAGIVDNFDLLFLDTTIDHGVGIDPTYQVLKERFDRCCLERDQSGIVRAVEMTLVEHITCSSSYLVNPRSVDRLCAVYEAGISAGLPAPIDYFIGYARDRGRLRVACLFPFLTSVRPDLETTIAGRNHNALAMAALGMARYSFFVDCDHVKLAEYAERLLPGPTDPLPQSNDPHMRVLDRAFSFLLSQLPI